MKEYPLNPPQWTAERKPTQFVTSTIRLGDWSPNEIAATQCADAVIERKGEYCGFWRFDREALRNIIRQEVYQMLATRGQQ